VFLEQELSGLLEGWPSFNLPAIKTSLPAFRRCTRRFCGLVTLLAAAALCGAAEVPAIPDYKVGERAGADIVTPVALVVFDATRTDGLRKAEAQKVPPVFRFDPDAGARAEATLKTAFAGARAKFVDGLENLIGHPPPLLANELAGKSFADFLGAFRKEQPRLPLTDSLAELWALGDSGDVVLEGMLAMLRRFAGVHVREDNLPSGERLTTGSVRLISAGETNAELTLASVDRRGRNFARTNLITLTRLRQEIQKSGTPEEAPALKFVAGFVQPNCLFDAGLTQQVRARRTAAINAADHYEAGQTIIAQGETVSHKAKLALDELRARTAAERAQSNAILERSKVEAQAAQARLAAATTRRVNRWLVAGLSMAVLLLVALVWAGVLRRRRAAALVPLDSSLAIVAPGKVPADDADWRERALAAEARAQKATAMLRASLLPHLARWMMNELVQRLLSQRSEIMTGQQKAEREVAELAARLEQVHAPLEDRLRAYEQRIAELEAELAAKGEQNLDLIKAKIETTRKKLEGERSQERLDWN